MRERGGEREGGRAHGRVPRKHVICAERDNVFIRCTSNLAHISQIMVLALRQKAFIRFKVFRLRSEAVEDREHGCVPEKHVVCAQR